MSAVIISDPTIPSPGATPAGPRDDPFAIGWRDVFRERADGTTEHIQIPLTAEDALHPRVGDVIVEGTLHSIIRNYLASVFRMRLANDPHALVLSDTGVYWDDPELGHHVPDVAAIFDVKERRKDWKSFYVEEQGTRPQIIVEIVSTETRKNDVEIKLQQYHQAGVRTYVIVDRDKSDNLRLLGYQFGPKKYLPMPTDEMGRLWLEPIGVLLGLKDENVVCYDAETGEEIPNLIASQARLQAAELRIRELEEQLKSRNPST